VYQKLTVLIYVTMMLIRSDYSCGWRWRWWK